MRALEIEFVRVGIMNLEKLRALVVEVIDRLPTRLQGVVYETIAATRYLVFRIRLARYAYGSTHKNIPDPSRVYWISPKRIVYHTNYLKNRDAETVPFSDRVFGPEMRGQVVDGNWDITNWKFTDLGVYQAFQKRIEQGMEWEDTEFYRGVLRQAESGKSVWSIKNRDDLDRRCRYLDSLYESIKNEGYRLNRNIHYSAAAKNTAFDEIDVNIGRNGEYLFQNGVHRLSIAKILGVKCVPVMVFVRHKKWQDFREFVISYSKRQPTHKLYQPIVHPDLADIPYDRDAHDCEDLMKSIEHHLGKSKGVMLDVGANLGFFCHKFEDLGYQCYAVEKDIAAFQILERIRIAENKRFTAINRSIFEVELVRKMKFDVVLALNIFHHFLKTKKGFSQLKDLLKNLKVDELFFEPHRYEDGQMKDAYVNYTEAEFVDFLLRYASLRKSEAIYTATDGRTVFKLSK